jgi:hypothetical protein
VDVKPPSLDPFLSEPTTHAKAELQQLEAEEGASSAGGSDVQLFLSERFEHQEGEDGDHYIVTGRNGQIERCEDEVSRPLDSFDSPTMPALLTLSLLPCSLSTSRELSRLTVYSSLSNVSKMAG